MSYTHSQQVALALIPKFTASVGILSSLFILTELIRDHKKGEGNPIKRVLLGVTLYEIMSAFGWWLSSWVVPKSTEFVFASGTIGSCSFQGFLLQIAIGAPLNNGLLTYFFFLVVQQNYSTEMMLNLEWKMHALVGMFAFGSAFLMLGLKQYNPMNQICWIEGSPSGCGNSSPIFNPDVPCDRGDNAYWYGIFFFYIVLWSMIVLMIVLNWMMRRKLLAEHSKDVQWITTQALLYSLAFFVTWMPSTIWSIMDWTQGGGFGLDVLSTLCEPLQGFWNMLIFIHNRPESIERLNRIFRCQCCRMLSNNDDDYDVEFKEERKVVDQEVIIEEDNTLNETTSVQLTENTENPRDITVNFSQPSLDNYDISIVRNTRLYA